MRIPEARCSFAAEYGDRHTIMDSYLHIVQANVGYGAAVQDLLLQGMKQWPINIAAVTEPYTHRFLGPGRSTWMARWHWYTALSPALYLGVNQA